MENNKLIQQLNEQLLVAEYAAQPNEESRIQLATMLLLAIKRNEKIPAIKALRSLGFFGLKEAKDIVDQNWPNPKGGKEQGA